MKKVIAAILMLSVAICFAACKKKDTPATTAPADLSADFSTTEPSVAADENTAPQVEGMLLTTQAGETQPTVATTQFVPDPAAVTAITTQPNAATSPYSVPSMSAPPVVTSQQPGVTYVTVNPNIPAQQPVTPSSYTPTAATPSTTVPTAPKITTTSPTSATTTPTTAKPTETTTTTKPAIKAITASKNDEGYSGKKVIVTVDGSNWEGRIVAKSANVNVTVDGVSKTVPASVSGAAAGANPTVVIDLSNVSISNDSTITYTIPAQLIQSSEGQYNKNSIAGTVQLSD